MAKKTTTATKQATPAIAKAPAAAPTVTTVRNSAVPPKSSPGFVRKPNPTHDQIALAAYYIWKSGTGGSQEENWFRAERQLRGY